jgi:rhodanese-related sulfurtransferase
MRLFAGLLCCSVMDLAVGASDLPYDHECHLGDMGMHAEAPFTCEAKLPGEKCFIFLRPAPVFRRPEASLRPFRNDLPEVRTMFTFQDAYAGVSKGVDLGNGWVRFPLRKTTEDGTIQDHGFVPAENLAMAPMTDGKWVLPADTGMARVKQLACLSRGDPRFVQTRPHAVLDAIVYIEFVNATGFIAPGNCTGAYIESDHVSTAAHCALGIAGVLKKGGRNSDIARVRVHFHIGAASEGGAAHEVIEGALLGTFESTPDVSIALPYDHQYIRLARRPRLDIRPLAEINPRHIDVGIDPHGIMAGYPADRGKELGYHPSFAGKRTLVRVVKPVVFARGGAHEDPGASVFGYTISNKGDSGAPMLFRTRAGEWFALGALGGSIGSTSFGLNWEERERLGLGIGVGANGRRWQAWPNRAGVASDPWILTRCAQVCRPESMRLDERGWPRLWTLFQRSPADVEIPISDQMRKAGMCTRSGDPGYVECDHRDYFISRGSSISVDKKTGLIVGVQHNPFRLYDFRANSLDREFGLNLAFEETDAGLAELERRFRARVQWKTDPSVLKESGIAVLSLVEARKEVFRSDSILISALVRQGVFIPGTVQIATAGKDDSASKEDLRAALAEITTGDVTRRLVFYCAHYDCAWSITAARSAMELGYKNVALFPAGIEGWMYARLPTEADGNGLSRVWRRPSQ